MPSLNISVLGDSPESRASAAQSIGKKSTVDDVGFYHTVYSGKIVSVVEPATYPTKFQSLLQAIGLSDHILVLAQQPTPALGEIIITLDLLGKDAVFVSENDLSPFLSATSLKNAKIFASLQEAKEHLLSQQSPSIPGSTQIPIDHCFEVKGVGTVALGLVTRGGVKVHDNLVSYPSGTQIQVRTIQRNDVDVQSAECGDRVGLSLKGAKSTEVDRGAVFAAEPMQVSKEIQCELSVAKFSKSAISNGLALHLGAGLQFEPVKIECEAEIKQGTKGNAKLILQAPIAFNKEDRLLICDLNAKGLRAVASAKSI